MNKTVLILGAKGRLGVAAAQAFAAAGWRVLGQVRPGAAQPALHGVEWLATSLDDTQTLTRQAQGASVVLHALSPAYTNAAWTAQVLPMTKAALTIAADLEATIMVPGNVYNFGADAPTVLRPDTPQQAHTVKGCVRMAMEQALAQSDVQTIVLRAGDFFGQGTGSWFDTVVAKELPKGVLRYPAPSGVRTPWAYLPDLAQAFVRVAEKREQLGRHTVLHFAGHNLSATDWADALTQEVASRGWVTRGQAVRVKALPWGVLRVGGWFNPVFAALYEMRYLWQRPYELDNATLVQLIGDEPRTPFPRAAVAAVNGLFPWPSGQARHAAAVLR